MTQRPFLLGDKVTKQFAEGYEEPLEEGENPFYYRAFHITCIAADNEFVEIDDEFRTRYLLDGSGQNVVGLKIVHWQDEFDVVNEKLTLTEQLADHLEKTHLDDLDLDTLRKVAELFKVKDPSPVEESNADCTCYLGCEDDSLSGQWHQHEDDPCPAHPDAPMV